MKKLYRVLALTMALATCGTVMAGCTGGKTSKKDEIIVEPFSASGFGIQWLKDLAKDWMAENPGYTVKVKENSTYLSGTQLAQIEAGTTTTDVYFGGYPNYSSGFYKGYFEDLSDMLTMKPDGEDGLTVQEKIVNFDNWKKVAGKVSYDEATDEFSYSGCYMLPHSTTLSGLVYDHDEFLKNGWLTYAENTAEVKADLAAQGITFEESELPAQNPLDEPETRLVFKSSTGITNYESDEYILTAGKDGKYGTYDDGQPQTMAEFDEMVEAIVSAGKVPFVYSTENEYVTELANAYVVQYAGLDAYDALTAFDSNGKEITLQDGSSVVIDWSNGYRAQSLKGIEDAVSFINDNFLNSDYFTTGTGVQDAQDKFIAGGLGTSTYIAMLMEGNWFELEAMETLKAAARRNPQKGYGKVDYRMMLMPEIEGQKGIDGNGNGTVFPAVEAGAIVVRTQKYPEKLEAIKSFILYTLTDEALSETTKKTGLVRGYKYDLTAEQIAEMTPYQRTCYQIYQDTENIKVITPTTDMLRAPFPYAAIGYTSDVGMLPCRGVQSILNSLKGGKSVAEVVDGIANNYNEGKWNGFLTSIKNNL
ncbi:MAG: hypothetical protein IJ308_00495 [Clostridia bacterium]|nr:hypothetical protein [Clostridia bacterium]